MGYTINPRSHHIACGASPVAERTAALCNASLEAYERWWFSPGILVPYGTIYTLVLVILDSRKGKIKQNSKFHALDPVHKIR